MSISVATFGRIWAVFFGALLCLSATSSSATAQNKGEDSALMKAEIRFFEGLKAYRTKDFEGAIRAFQEVYLQTKNADMLFNIARSYEQLAQPRLAAQWYKGLSDTKPVDQSATLRRIASLTPKARKGAAGDAKKGALQEKVLLALKPVELQPRTTRWVKWGLIGVAGSALTVATVVGFQSLDDAKKRDQAEDDLAREQLSNRADRSQLTALGFTAIGLIAGGVATYLIIDEARPKPVPDGIGAIVTGDGAGISYSSSF